MNNPKSTQISASAKPSVGQAVEDVGDVRDVVREVRHLLRDYAPTWYSEDMDTRLSQALVMLEASEGEAIY